MGLNRYFFLHGIFHLDNLLAHLYVPYYNIVYYSALSCKRALTLPFFSQGGGKAQSFFSYKRYSYALVLFLLYVSFPVSLHQCKPINANSNSFKVWTTYFWLSSCMLTCLYFLGLLNWSHWIETSVLLACGQSSHTLSSEPLHDQDILWPFQFSVSLYTSVSFINSVFFNYAIVAPLRPDLLMAMKNLEFSFDSYPSYVHVP